MYITNENGFTMVDDDDLYELSLMKRGHRPPQADRSKLLNTRIDVFVTEEVKQDLDKLAEQNKTTTPKFIRKIFNEYLNKDDKGLER